MLSKIFVSLSLAAFLLAGSLSLSSSLVGSAKANDWHWQNQRQCRMQHRDRDHDKNCRRDNRDFRFRIFRNRDEDRCFCQNRRIFFRNDFNWMNNNWNWMR